MPKFIADVEVTPCSGNLPAPEGKWGEAFCASGGGGGIPPARDD